MSVQTGHLGNLTPEQEVKLREFWAKVLAAFDVLDPHATPAPTTATSTPESSIMKKKKRHSIFNKKDKSTDPEGPGGDEEDKYGQTEEYHTIMRTTSPEILRQAFWTMVKSDHPDALLLRFLRARKWNVDRALYMLISTMHWRSQEMHVDDDVIRHGDGGALNESHNGKDEQAKKQGQEFLAQLRLGKSFLHGTDKDGRPICFVRARLHHSGDQSERAMERYTVYVIETARLALRTPVETACILFDMTNFTMANMDYAPVKFMIKVFEANYPESLGIVLVHKAPWIFNAIWTIIKGWLDPVVASKVHFTKSVEDLEAYIPRSQILKELGGTEHWEYHYVEPAPGENALMEDEAARTKLEEKRRAHVLTFQQKTFDWIQSGSYSETVRPERDAIAHQLNTNYWQLDPYVRARTLYDRTGMIENGGKINFYPSIDTSKSLTNGSVQAGHTTDAQGSHR